MPSASPSLKALRARPFSLTAALQAIRGRSRHVRQLQFGRPQHMQGDHRRRMSLRTQRRLVRPPRFPLTLLPLAEQCNRYAATHPIDPAIRQGTSGPELGGPIEIGDNCWFGGSITVLPNVKIGTGVVVGAGSVVTKVCTAHFQPSALPTSSHGQSLALAALGRLFSHFQWPCSPSRRLSWWPECLRGSSRRSSRNGRPPTSRSIRTRSGFRRQRSRHGWLVARGKDTRSVLLQSVVPRERLHRCRPESPEGPNLSSARGVLLQPLVSRGSDSIPGQTSLPRAQFVQRTRSRLFPLGPSDPETRL